MDSAGIESWEVLGTVLGSDLEMIKTKHPIMERESVVICGEHVTLDAGTGCVHTAPGFGAEDFTVCQKYKIDIIVPVDGKGYATAEAGKYAGMYYEKTTPVILDDLKACNALLAIEEIEHSYPHCWRCKNPIIFRATEQWFCSVDALKEDAVKACHDITWLPAWGEERMTSMVQERSDWCISRQRIWGVPIPIFICKDCGKPLVNEQTIEIVSKLFKEHGSNCWLRWTHLKCYQAISSVSVAAQASIRKPTQWTFGLTLVQAGRLLSVSVKVSQFLLIFILRVMTSIVVGSSPLC